MKKFSTEFWAPPRTPSSSNLVTTSVNMLAEDKPVESDEDNWGVGAV